MTETAAVADVPNIREIEHLWEMERPGPKLKPGSRRWLLRYKLNDENMIEGENDDKAHSITSPRGQAMAARLSDQELLE